MVEYSTSLDAVFHCLADPIRREILWRLRSVEQTVGALVEQFTVSFAAISKHIKVMEEAQVITKRRQGRHQIVQLNAQALAQADFYLEQYRQIWESRYQKLDQLLKGEEDI